MSHITLVRHGQANTGARDEVSYDRLSPLGHQQAQWLGDHLRTTQATYSRVYCGTLRRHWETADGMGFSASCTEDKRLNEMEYFSLSEAMEAQHGLAIPTEREGFATHIPQVFSAWAEGRIEAPYESWTDFSSRVHAALREIAAGHGPALIITSGGVIGMMMRHCLDLDAKATAHIVLGIMNSSLHRFYQMDGRLYPDLYNAVPHLDAPERHYARTHL
ncbi:histidine phosphatase family protein [Epibacterium ulvae]|uniref:Broad specificity phosphatase PhoE n=1 Tax=Epibacterium ulvae TaxID=1156985 RepID=A0A1G5QYQ7_9RHOB|nr:histidine phosphatase family protein [Epibacterium ulvae]SCZ66728.1 Broad specificity phosphatase PhoE [Epibacterium ulvae]